MSASSSPVTVGIVGGTGYTGLELLRLLLLHPGVTLRVITSRGEAGTRVTDLFPGFRGRCDLSFEPPEVERLAGCDLVFFAAPNGTAMEMARDLLERGVRIVDLAADFRLRDTEEWTRWYGTSHRAPELLSEAVYGLPEINRQRIERARLVANPGCYATAVQLGFLPLLERDVVEPDRLIADAKSGVSGAGRKEALATQLCEASENMKAYSASGHRHLPEILQGLEEGTGTRCRVIFVPHLTPMIRGIHATLYAPLRPGEVDVQEIFEERYAGEPFVDVLAPGAHPETRTVRGSNMCRLSCHRPGDGDTAVVLSVIDNLGKGAAGQAIQNMNIMLGFDESSGLDQAAVMP